MAEKELAAGHDRGPLHGVPVGEWSGSRDALNQSLRRRHQGRSLRTKSIQKAPQIRIRLASKARVLSA